MGRFGSPKLFTTPMKSKDAARAAGIAAAEAYVDQTDVAEAIAEEIFKEFRNQVPDGAQFWTGSIYSDVTVVDIGAMRSPKDSYHVAVGGGLKSGTAANVAMPHVARTRIGNPPKLGQELFWGGAPTPANNAPYAVVVASPAPPRRCAAAG